MFNKNKRLELLSPAGDLEGLKQAVKFGADAVYLGGLQFGMRQASANFTEDELNEGISFAHQNGVKIYLTCNTLPRQNEIDALPDFLRGAQAAGVDALIICDIGVLALAREIVPDMEIHISTQFGVVNSLSAAELHRLGAARVVLAREVSLNEIADIRKNIPEELELEAFVHGSMCMSVSGRCTISNYLTARDANRGECAQPCRWKYHLMEEKRPGEFFPIEEGEGGSYILNSKDLCMIEHIDKLVDAGVISFKIEGRAKSSYYTAVATKAYRAAIDAYLQNPSDYKPEQWILDEVFKLSHRKYSTGFYFDGDIPGQCHDNGGYERDYEVAAVVASYDKGIVELIEKNRFYAGDSFELVEPKGAPVIFTIDEMTDENGAEVKIANKPHQRIFVKSDKPIEPGSYLRKKV